MIFSSKPRITQYFGANSDYYSQFHLFGHEGLDLVPTGPDFTIYSWMRGVIGRRYTSDIYGETIIIYESKNALSWRLAHLSKVFVEEGDYIEYDNPIGIMGDTPTGRAGIDGKMKAHLHINCVPMTTWSTKDFELNGFKGRVDPLGVLRERGEI